MSRIAVTGIGVISALGGNTEENFNGLLKGHTGISHFPEIEGHPYRAQIPLSDEVLKGNLKIEISRHIPRTALIGLIAAKEAIGNKLNPHLKTGFINGSTVGGMDLSEGFYKNFREDIPDDIEKVKLHDLGELTDFMANLLGDFDLTQSISTACSTAPNAIIQGAQWIAAGLVDQVLVGATDALSEFTSKGFGSLMIYDTERCKPFDKERKGLNLGEGAGYLLLESEKSLSLSKAKPIAFLRGWGHANDAFHPTGSSPEGKGAAKAMELALQKANLSPENIDYINTHGTGTKNNDASEFAAMKSVFETLPPYASTKGFTGHTLAASGGIESVFAITGMNKGIAIKSLGCQNPEFEESPPLSQTHSLEQRFVMSNSFGFGGNCTSLIFEKAE